MLWARSGIELVGRNVLRPAEDRRWHQLDGQLPTAPVEIVDHGLAVEPVGDGLADGWIAERLDVLVDAEEPDVEGGAPEHLQLGVILDDRDVLRLDEVVPVNLAGLQRLQPGGVVRDGQEDERLQVRGFAPVVLVAREHQPVAAVPLLQRVRSGAGRVLECVAALVDQVAVSVDGRGVRVVLLKRGGAGNGKRRQ